MLKRIFIYFLSFLLIAQPAMAHANSVGNAFGGLLSGASSNISSPGYLQSQTRNVFTGGAMEIRFGQKSVTFISIQPPSLNIGCNGISAFFGGFSFINGEMIAQLLQNIAQAAVAFAIKLAIKTLCPQCEAVLGELTALAQKAAGMAGDSCRIGQKLADLAVGKLFPEPKADNGAKQKCGESKTTEGAETDFLASMTSSICQGADKILGWYNDFMGSGSTNKDDPSKGAAVQGNVVWMVLKSMGFENDSARLIMSITGAPINYIKKEGATVGCMSGPLPTSDADKESPTDTCVVPPLIHDKDLMVDLLMCGTDWDLSTDQTVQSYCGQRTALGSSSWATNVQIYECMADKVNSDPTVLCLNPIAGSVTQLSEVAGTGFLVKVSESLKAGVDAVSKGDPLPPATIQLVNSVPFPLYRMLNIAAVYPSVADQLVDANATIIAFLMANALLRQMVTSAPNPKGSSASGAALAEMRELLLQMQKNLEHKTVVVNNAHALQAGLMNDINAVNRSIQVQVMSNGLLANQSFAVGVIKGVK